MDRYHILRKFLNINLSMQDKHDYRQDTAFHPKKKSQYLSPLAKHRPTFDEEALRRLWGMDDD